MTPPAPRPRLTAQDVVDAAVGILQDFGMGDLSMRRVAGVLGVQASALYWHVPDKQSLLARVADRIVAEAEETVRARRVTDLAGRAEAAEAALLRHRDGADVVLSALALGLGGLGLHRLLTEAADTPEDGERALALLLGTVSLRQQRAQAQALGVATGPDVQRHRTDPL
ncbi:MULTISPECIES: TetR family transcriptional regulator [Micrococcus]|uniref:AcrR family transcriptional regulator n=2 Tax=Micrococcus TaxID=1269 RepID=A0ABR6D2M4_9MICC|nr:MULTISPECIES: TetR/AcrR family transcriptional regulator [Micrococcus]TFI18667.1 TetR/AcrR family transcriptional regulator [Thiopseudomonas sp. 4R-3cl]CVM58351.1 Tetracycline repressor protein class D [Streptococcus pneumoniae]EZP42148.1 Transcriptional regulator, TetR family [Micrococcus luteus]EZP55387.1 Transcriptional regulator, TetR family [Micrococcus luteus]MBA9060018.1 AcrR family transcriptional regulator [Micrococcus yunnanensis]